MRLRTVVAAFAAACAAAPALVLAPLPLPATDTLPQAAAESGAATSRYVPLPTPTRLLDTRDLEGGLPLGPGGIAGVTVAGDGLFVGDVALPAAADTMAVVLNVTVVGPANVGFWTVFPASEPQPLTASLYVDEPHALLGANLALPNLVTVPVGPDGVVHVFTQTGGHVVVDMLGSYQRADLATAGRLDPLPVPDRILDTRNPGSVAVEAQTSIDVTVPGGAGASAAVLTATTIAFGAGYWTMYPAGTAAPLAANLNSLHPFHLGANQVVVPLDAEGRFSVFSQSGGHLVLDLVALVTGDTAPESTDGLFVPLGAPTRFTDTRDPAVNPLGGSQMALPTWNLEIGVSQHPSVARPDVAAVAMNLSITEALAAGYVSAAPAGTSDPANKARGTATMNIGRAGQTLAIHAIVAIGSRGVEVFTQSGGHVVADLAGYYLGTPVDAPYGTPQNANPTPFGCVGFAGAPVSQVVNGSSRATVSRVQQRLLDLGFWNAGTDGSYGQTTSQAVMAFQKWVGLPRTSIVDEATAAAMNRMLCKPTPGITSGDLLEVDKGKQLLFIIRGGKLVWVLNTSTGGNYRYTAVDKKTGAKIDDVAITPSGSFNVYRVHDDPNYFGSLGELYRPRFFVGGVAVHGYRSIPNYPASHGCVRVSNAAMDMIWANNFMPMRSRVVVHD